MRSVTIVGAGPAGLTAAHRLARAGLTDVLVLERNPEAGGLPRFCGHSGWGMLDLHRLYTGPRYASALVQRAAGAEIATRTSVLALEPGGRLQVSTPSGPAVIESRVVLLATGIREMPRGPRLVSGTRPWGVITTGAFQEMVYAGGLRPFRRPVIVGSELVAFSALLTARHAGVQPLAILEQGPRILARRPGDLLARRLFGVPVLTGTRLIEIRGGDRVEGVVIERDGRRDSLACDGVIFTCRFTPEAFLARAGRLDLDEGTGGPVIDTLFRCTDPAYFAAGNLLRPVEHSGIAAREGAQAARAILRALRGDLPPPDTAIPVSAGGALRYVYPQRVVPERGMVRLHGRALHRHRGRLRVIADGAVLAERHVSVLPERRLSLTLPAHRLQGRRSLQIMLD
jgi:thioredoxin reductase